MLVDVIREENFLNKIVYKDKVGLSGHFHRNQVIYVGVFTLGLGLIPYAINNKRIQANTEATEPDKQLVTKNGNQTSKNEFHKLRDQYRATLNQIKTKFPNLKTPEWLFQYLQNIKIDNGKIVINKELSATEVFKLQLSDEQLGNFEFPQGVTLSKYDIQTVCPIDRYGNCKVPSYVTKIANNAFENNAELKTIDLPENLKEIGYAAFANTGLENIKIPNGLTKIKASTFNDCRYLKTITLPESLQEMGRYAFSKCCTLKTIVIPKNVTTIEHEAFYFCIALKNITIEADLNQFQDLLFLENLQKCENITFKGNYSDYDKEQIKQKFDSYLQERITFDKSPIVGN